MSSRYLRGKEKNTSVKDNVKRQRRKELRNFFAVVPLHRGEAIESYHDLQIDTGNTISTIKTKSTSFPAHHLYCVVHYLNQNTNQVDRDSANSGHVIQG